jgi:hypothetical protein
MGRLSRMNRTTAEERARRVTCLLIEAGYKVVHSQAMDLGGCFALIIENPDAEFYTPEQVASGEAYDLAAARDLEAVNGRLA